MSPLGDQKDMWRGWQRIALLGWISYFCYELGSITHSQLSSFNHGYVWFMLSNQIFTPAYSESHKSNNITLYALCALWGMLWMFIPIEFVNPAPPSDSWGSLEWSVSVWGVKRRADWEVHSLHTSPCQDPGWLSCLTSIVSTSSTATCLNPPQEAAKKRCKLWTLSR